MALRIAPQTRDEWIALVLLPAKVFLTVLVVLSALDFPFRFVTPAATKVLAWCFCGSGLFLLAGAIVQDVFCQRGAGFRTLMFLGIAFLFLLYSYRGVGVLLAALICWPMWRYIRSAMLSVSITQEPVECLKCHAILGIAESRCPRCGWSFNP